MCVCIIRMGQFVMSLLPTWCNVWAQQPTWKQLLVALRRPRKWVLKGVGYFCITRLHLSHVVRHHLLPLMHDFGLPVVLTCGTQGFFATTTPCVMPLGAHPSSSWAVHDKQVLCNAPLGGSLFPGSLGMLKPPQTPYFSPTASLGPSLE